MTRQRKGKAKDIEQEALFKETIALRPNFPVRLGKVHLEKNIVFLVPTTKEEIPVMIEIYTLDILCIANTSRKIFFKW